jgi:hypothetical protein
MGASKRATQLERKAYAAVEIDNQLAASNWSYEVPYANFFVWWTRFNGLQPHCHLHHKRHAYYYYYKALAYIKGAVTSVGANVNSSWRGNSSPCYCSDNGVSWESVGVVGHEALSRDLVSIMGLSRRVCEHSQILTTWALLARQRI